MVMFDPNVCESSLPEINNIKLRFNVSKEALLRLKRGISNLSKKSASQFTPKKKPVFKEHHNFIVFRHSYVYIVFSTSGTVNVTGIRFYRDISSAVALFCREFGLRRRHVGAVTVDNLTASGNFGSPVNLRLLKKSINASQEGDALISSASYNPSFFPACFCRTYVVGTIIVFASGKYNIVGGKCRDDVNNVFRAMLAHMKKQ